jgi:hypothetical protein
MLPRLDTMNVFGDEAKSPDQCVSPGERSLHSAASITLRHS